MNATRYTRNDAWILLNTYTKSESLLKHALGVEACMQAYGEKQASLRELAPDDREQLVAAYRVTGLLHDFDYEQYPSAEQHPFVGNKILGDLGWPEEIRE